MKERARAEKRVAHAEANGAGGSLASQVARHKQKRSSDAEYSANARAGASTEQQLRARQCERSSGANSSAAHAARPSWDRHRVLGTNTLWYVQMQRIGVFTACSQARSHPRRAEHTTWVASCPRRRADPDTHSHIYWAHEGMYMYMYGWIMIHPHRRALLPSMHTLKTAPDPAHAPLSDVRRRRLRRRLGRPRIVRRQQGAQAPALELHPIANLRKTHEWPQHAGFEGESS